MKHYENNQKVMDILLKVTKPKRKKGSENTAPTNVSQLLAAPLDIPHSPENIAKELSQIITVLSGYQDKILINNKDQG